MIQRETLDAALAYFPVAIPDSDLVLVKWDQYIVFRQATLALRDLMERMPLGN